MKDWRKRRLTEIGLMMTCFGAVAPHDACFPFHCHLSTSCLPLPGRASVCVYILLGRFSGAHTHTHTSIYIHLHLHSDTAHLSIAITITITTTNGGGDLCPLSWRCPVMWREDEVEMGKKKKKKEKESTFLCRSNYRVQIFATR